MQFITITVQTSYFENDEASVLRLKFPRRFINEDLSFSAKGRRFGRYSASLFKKNCPNALFWANEKLVSTSYAVEIRSVANGNSLDEFHFERFFPGEE
jgi:hypothetical protein